jgi:hypothetical protein
LDGLAFCSDVLFMVWNTLFADYSFFVFGTYGLIIAPDGGPAVITEQGTAYTF